MQGPEPVEQVDIARHGRQPVVGIERRFGRAMQRRRRGTEPLMQAAAGGISVHEAAAPARPSVAPMAV